MIDAISRQAAIDALAELQGRASTKAELKGISKAWKRIEHLPSVTPKQPEIIRCKDCKHNPKDEWFGFPMSHLSEAQRPETAWCWKAERRTDESD